MLKRWVLVALCLLLAACGGGGSGSIPSVPGAVHTAGGSASIRISIPSASGSPSQRRRAYVGSDVEGATVAVSQGAGTPLTTAFDLSSGSTLCTSSGSARSCTMTVTAPYGADTFAVTTYDSAPSGGVIPASAHVLGTATLTSTISANSTTAALQIFVQGVIANFGASTPLITLASGSGTQTQTMMFDPTDFANQPITAGANDTYANPIEVTLVETGGSGLTQLTVNGTPAGTNVTLTQSNQTLGVTYTGGGSAGYYATVTMSATGVAPATFNVAPMYIGASSPLYTPYSIAFSGSGQSVPLTISEAKGSNTYTATQSTASACIDAASVSAVSGSGANASVTVTGGSGAVSGGCNLVVTDALNTTLTIGITNTTSGGSVTVGGVSEYPAAHAQPFGVTSGPDGDVWVMETSAVEKLTTAGTAAATYSTGTDAIGAIVPGSDGYLYFVDGTNHVWKLSTSGTLSSTTTGTDAFNGITQGPDGNLWAVDTYDGIVEVFSTQLLSLASYSVAAQPGSGIASGSDGRVYLADSANSTVYAFTPGNATPDTYTLNAACQDPSAIVSDPVDGNLYVGCIGSNSILQLRVDGTQTNYPIGQGDSPRGLAVGPDGSIWFAGFSTSSIGRFNISNQTFTHVAIPTANAEPESLALGADGRIWFTEYAAEQIGALVP